MANTDRARGLWPIRQVGGGKIPMNAYRKGNSTTQVGEGDVVQIEATSKTVEPCMTTTGSGSVVGVAANYVASGASNTGDTVWVYDSPYTVFGVNSDGATDANHRDMVGGVYTQKTFSAANTTTGLSKVELDYSQNNSTVAGGLFMVVGVCTEPNNNQASSHADLEVMLSRHVYLRTEPAIDD